MSYFDDASLVMIPSGYKTSKVYSVKPTDGSGDLTFSRSNDTATRVNSAGLIEKVRTNLVLQSETFNNASWAKTFGASITANTAANPLTGTQTADTIYADATNDFHYISQSITYSAGEATLSIYAKANGYSWFVIDSGFSNAFGYFNITTGAVGTKGSACTTAITSVGSGWYRCSVTFTATASASSLFLSIRNADNGGSFLGDGVSGFFIYGAQAEMGVATSYIATTSAAVSVGPVANVPRLDYLNSSCPRLLLEPQRTNLVFYSEQLTNASWSASAVITANTAVSPDGYMNADSVMESGANDFHIIGDPVTTTSGTTYTFSFFAKPNGRNFARVLFGNGSFPDNQSAYFNLLTGATSATASVTASMVSYGNGWYRCIATCTSDANATEPTYFGPARNMTDGYGTYTGNPSLGIYAWGVQQEAGAYATSYIPTLGAAVTRGADAASKTGISSLIGQTAGTIFVDFVWNGLQDPAATDSAIFSIGIQEYGTSNITISNYNGTMYARVTNGVTVEATINFGSLVAGTRYKAALAYANNDVVFYVNGVSYGSDTSASIPAISDLNFQNAYPNAKMVNQALLFKTRLSNADLAALTTI